MAVGIDTDHVDLLFGVASQTISLDVPEGRPSSVTSVGVYEWNVGTNSTAESATTGSASIDSVDTTVDAASGASQSDPKVLYLASTTGIAADRRYLVTDAQGRKEWVLVSGVTAGESVTAILGLGLDYVSGDTFESTRISISASDTWTANAQNINGGAYAWDRYRVRWEYVVSSVTYVRYTTLSLVRQPAQHAVRPGDVDLRFPGFLNLFPIDYRGERAQLLIDEAYNELSTDLLNVGLPDEQVRSQKVINELTILKTCELVMQSRALLQGDYQGLEVASEIYSKRFESIFRAPGVAKVPVGSDDTSAGDKRGALPLTVR